VVEENIPITPEKSEINRSGRFYKYTSLSNLVTLQTGKTIAYDGKNEFDVVTGSKWNPGNHESIVPLERYALRCLHTFRTIIRAPELPNVRLAYDAQAKTDLIKIYQQTIKKHHPNAGELSDVLSASASSESLQPFVDFFRSIGGEDLMIGIKRLGYDAFPAGSYSDLIPISVGAPLGKVSSDRVVFLELEFENNELIIPKDDALNEHELFVRCIKPINLKDVYRATDADWKRLNNKLKNRFPNDFNPKNPFEIIDFARRVPLNKILKMLDIQ